MRLPTALSVLSLLTASASAAPSTAPSSTLNLSTRSGTNAAPNAFHLKLASNTSHCLGDQLAPEGRDVYLRKGTCDEGGETWAFNTAFPGSFTVFNPQNIYALGSDGPMEDGRKSSLRKPDQDVPGQKWTMDDQGRLSVGDSTSTPKLCLSANEGAEPFEEIHLQVCGSGEEGPNSPIKQRWTLDYNT